jgi:methylmalonyl-CoA mutase
LVPQLVEQLAAQGARDVVVVVGGVVPVADYDFLKAAGVSAVFGPGSNIPRAASEILALVRERRSAA